MAALSVGRDHHAVGAGIDTCSFDQVTPGQAGRALKARARRGRAETVDSACSALWRQCCGMGSAEIVSFYPESISFSNDNVPSQTFFRLSYTQPFATLVVPLVAPAPSQRPVPPSNATQPPPFGMRTFGLRQLRQPSTPAAKHVSQRGLHSTQAEVAEFQNVRAGHVTKVPFVEAVVAVTHLVPSLESGWRPDRHVRQVAFGPEQDSHEGSQAGDVRTRHQPHLPRIEHLVDVLTEAFPRRSLVVSARARCALSSVRGRRPTGAAAA